MSGASNVAGDRRTPGLSRVPFEALVEIAAPEGTSFEAESIDLSASGMHLKTAYLPDVGTPLTFRFESGADAPPVLANGEVVWAHDGSEGSEFGGGYAGGVGGGWQRRAGGFAQAQLKRAQRDGASGGDEAPDVVAEAHAGAAQAGGE